MYDSVQYGRVAI